MTAEITSTVATLHGRPLHDRAGAGRAQLVVIEGPDMGRAVTLGEQEILVGSGEGCHLALTDERVSRQHLAARSDPQGAHVRDLGSRNGTVYAGSAIGEALIPPGGTLKLGRSYLRLQPQPEAVTVTPSQQRRFGELVGESLAMREVFAVLELAAASEVTVLLEGETGTGKELTARSIHDAGPRRRGPFVALDCGALPEGLLESELFGHVRGAFTGAERALRGAFCRAQQGTLFLDELDSVPARAQARLLRVVEERRVRPVGGDHEQDLDVRLVAAARTDLAARVADGAFRPDLYYRLSVLRVRLPPLRQRREDIAPLVAELLRLRGFSDLAVGGENLDRLLAHAWPGNVRELRNVLDRAIALCPAGRSFADLPVGPAGPGADPGPGALPLRADLPFAEAKALTLRAFERRYLQDVLRRCGGNISAAARTSGVDRKHLRELLRRHGLLPGR